MRIKICGLTREEDVLAAVAAGADALGFNFWEGSPRRVTPAQAARLVALVPPFVATVGVFVNADPADVRRLTAELGLTAVQLHGDESAASCAACGPRVIKAARVRSREDLEALATFRAWAFLLDGFTPRFGGGGQPFDWSLVREASLARPIILAGGLTPANVGLAIRTARPHGVDVASGVEARPGVKDPQLLEAFVRAAHAATEVA